MSTVQGPGGAHGAGGPKGPEGAGKQTKSDHTEGTKGTQPPVRQKVGVLGRILRAMGFTSKESKIDSLMKHLEGHEATVVQNSSSIMHSNKLGADITSLLKNRLTESKLSHGQLRNMNKHLNKLTTPDERSQALLDIFDGLYDDSNPEVGTALRNNKKDIIDRYKWHSDGKSPSQMKQDKFDLYGRM